MSYTRAWPLAELIPGSCRLLKAKGAHVAVFRLEDGTVCAVDNRCPHEGYPLQQGEVKGTTLTCAWHNYKFALPSGACLMGDEAVRAYPVRVVDDVIEVDVRPPDPQAELPRLWASLGQAVLHRRQGQMARDVVRLLAAGVTPEAIAVWGAVYDSDHCEYGPSHALAVLADVLEWTRGRPGLEPALPLAQALDMASEPNIRRPARTRAEPRAHADWGAALPACVEAEDAAGAEALVRGAVAAGASRDELAHVLYDVVSTHFVDFGHTLIYQNKVFDLLQAGGWQHADALLGGHVFGIVNGTREDTLPPWAAFRRRLESVDLAELDARPRAGHMPLDALVNGRPSEVLARVLDSSQTLDSLLDALTEAGAHRLLRFDVAVDARTDVQDDWLDVTHRLTFVDAVRTAVGRWHDPRRWRFVLQAAWFVALAAPLDGPEPVAGAGSPPDLSAAIGARDVPGAIALVRGAIDAGQHAALRREFMEACMADLAVRPIVVTHLMKTTLAAFTAYERTGSPTAVMGLARWFASPVRERRVGRRVHEAIRLVVDGRPPVRLSS